MKRLEGKVAIVTGSSSGIGKAIALRFAEEGAVVVVAARRQQRCEEVVAQIKARGGEALAIVTDIQQESQVDQLVDHTVERFGRLDLLVNNAGVFSRRALLAETTTEAFDQVQNTNVRGTFFCCRAGFRHMRQHGGGTIINMSSVAGTDAWAKTGTYSASKFAIMGLTKALADEGREYGIKVCAICPGGVAHTLVDADPDLISESGQISPFDIAETAVYLATLGPHAIVHRVIVDRLGAEW